MSASCQVRGEGVRTGLRDGDNVLATKNSRNGVGLDGSGVAEVAFLDVGENDRVQTSVLELKKKLATVARRCRRLWRLTDLTGLY